MGGWGGRPTGELHVLLIRAISVTQLYTIVKMRYMIHFIDNSNSRKNSDNSDEIDKRHNNDNDNISSRCIKYDNSTIIILYVINARIVTQQ